MCAWIVGCAAERARRHVGPIHQQEEGIRQRLRPSCAGFSGQMAETSSDGQLVLQGDLVPGMIRLGYSVATFRNGQP